MGDNLNRRRPEDPSKININQDWELAYWSKKLGVSEEKLKEAVRAVGPVVAIVKVHLGLEKLRKA